MAAYNLAMITALLLCLASTPSQGQPADLEALAASLPDFSRVGYRAGQTPPQLTPTIDAAEFGAIAGDDKDDGPALQRALDAAAAAGGGVVRLPAGRYTLASRISIKTSGVVLQGAGSDSTMLACPLSLTDIAGPNRNWSWSGALLSLSAAGKPETLGTVPAAVPAGSTRLPLELAGDTPPPKAGEWLELSWYNDAGHDTLLHHLHGDISYPAAMLKELRGRSDPRVTEWVQVAAYKEGRLTLATAIGLELRPAWRPTLRRLPHISESGIEGLSFNFPKTKRQPHLKEHGYNAVSLGRAINCWVRDLRIEHADSGIAVGSSRQVTVQGITLTGKGLHHPLMLSRASHCLVTRWRIEAPHRHGTTLTWGAHLNVYSHGWGRDLALDCHRANAFDNLHTQIELEVPGDLIQPLRSGGSYGRGPHAARGNIYWNVAFDFLDPEEPLEITGLGEWPRGVFVGWHGNHSLRLRSDERYGHRVQDTNNAPAIANLHEYQVRLGAK